MEGAFMKLLLTLTLAAAVVVIPHPADAHPRQSCIGVKTVEHRHDHTTARTYLACPQKIRTQRLSFTNAWS